MKPVRGLPISWPAGLPKERRLALVSTAALLILVAGMVFYQQFSPPTEQGSPAPEVGRLVESPPAPPAVPESESTQAAPEALPEVVVRPERLSVPLSGSLRILKAYGSLDEDYGDFRLYNAIAYAVSPGQPVLAAARGKVSAIEDDPVNGTTLVLDHGGGMLTRYGGLGEVLVALNSQVEGGATIAHAGPPTPVRSGLGSHLVFGLLLDGEAANPAPYLSD